MSTDETKERHPDAPQSPEERVRILNSGNKVRMRRVVTQIDDLNSDALLVGEDYSSKDILKSHYIYEEIPMAEPKDESPSAPTATAQTPGTEVRFGPDDRGPTSEQIRAKADEVLALAKNLEAFDKWWLTLETSTNHAQKVTAKIAWLAAIRDVTATAARASITLAEALRRYGNHEDGCSSHFATGRKCDCGFDAALAARSTETERES